MTQLFLDTEFNSFGGALISMALVSECGREWYEVVEIPEIPHPWVAEHVIPILDKEPIGGSAFRASLHRFLRTFQHHVIYADWHEDFTHFFDALRGEDYGSSMGMALTAHLLSGLPEIRPERPHNALSDARALRDLICSGAGHT